MSDKEWAKKNREKNAAKQRAWVAANPDKAKDIRERWQKANPERQKEYQRKSAANARARARLELIEGYGGKCTCCGEAEAMFLSIEHIGGLKGRPRQHSHREILRLKAEGWPDDCTCLCFNCNLGSWRNGGVCPHQKDVID